MTHKRTIQSHLWNEKSFKHLPADSQLAFLFLLTHPHMTSLGAMRASVLGLAMELYGSFHRFYAALEPLCRQRWVRYDLAASLVWLPTFLQHNPPASPNVIKSWARVLNELPECTLRKQLIKHVKQVVLSLSPAFQHAAPTVFAPYGIEMNRLLSTFMK